MQQECRQYKFGIFFFPFLYWTSTLQHVHIVETSNLCWLPLAVHTLLHGSCHQGEWVVRMGRRTGRVALLFHQPLFQNTQVSSVVQKEFILMSLIFVNLNGLNWPLFLGPKLYKEPSFKSNKFIIHNAITRCCLAGKVNEPQKNKIVEVGTALVPESNIVLHSLSVSYLMSAFFSTLSSGNGEKCCQPLPHSFQGCQLPV